MDQAWLHHRPHLAPLVRTLDAVLKLADEQYAQGCASGEAVDYSEFEERVAQATARVEQEVHRIALSGLDVDVPFIRVWGKHYRQVHRIERTYGSLSGPVAVERTLYRELGQRQGPALDPIALRAGVVDGRVDTQADPNRRAADSGRRRLEDSRASAPSIHTTAL